MGPPGELLLPAWLSAEISKQGWVFRLWLLLGWLGEPGAGGCQAQPQPHCRDGCRQCLADLLSPEGLLPLSCGTPRTGLDAACSRGILPA